MFPLNKGLSLEELANWVFLVDALNFNFWTPDGEPKFSVQQNGKVGAANECYFLFTKLNIKHEEELLSFLPLSSDYKGGVTKKLYEVR